MSLRFSYTLLAPFYDALVAAALATVRRHSLARLPRDRPQRILLDGLGTGLDLPLLPGLHDYTGLDLTRAMLQRARGRAGRLRLAWVEGDSQHLPFRDGAFDHALLHLILAIVPDSAAALREAARVLRPGGRLFILDKFLRRGEPALLRRLVNPLMRRIATRTDVVFEDVLAAVPELRLIEDQPALAGGWFRIITLEKNADQERSPEPGSSSSRRGQVSQTMPTSSVTATATSIRNHTSPLIPSALMPFAPPSGLIHA